MLSARGVGRTNRVSWRAPMEAKMVDDGINSRRRRMRRRQSTSTRPLSWDTGDEVWSGLVYRWAWCRGCEAEVIEEVGGAGRARAARFVPKRTSAG